MTDQLDLQTTYSSILDAARKRRFISYGDLARANGVAWQKVRYTSGGINVSVRCGRP